MKILCEKQNYYGDPGLGPQSHITRMLGTPGMIFCSPLTLFDQDHSRHIQVIRIIFTLLLKLLSSYVLLQTGGPDKYPRFPL